LKILIASLLLLRVCPYTYLIISVNISLFINFKNFNLHSVRSQQLYLQIRKYFSRYQNFTWPTLIQVMVKLKLHIDILQHISTELTLWSAHQHQLHTHTHTTWTTSVDYTHTKKHFKINQSKVTHICGSPSLPIFSPDGLYVRYLPLSRLEIVVNITG